MDSRRYLKSIFLYISNEHKLIRPRILVIEGFSQRVVDLGNIWNCEVVRIYQFHDYLLMMSYIGLIFRFMNMNQKTRSPNFDS